MQKSNWDPYGELEPPQLPQDRINNERLFYVTSVDFTGALYTKGPMNIDSKSYICLFTSAATPAVHLEIVPALKTDSFILAFRRFVAVRSVPGFIMMSDNAPNFKAAAESIPQNIHYGTQ